MPQDGVSFRPPWRPDLGELTFFRCKRKSRICIYSLPKVKKAMEQLSPTLKTLLSGIWDDSEGELAVEGTGLVSRLMQCG